MSWLDIFKRKPKDDTPTAPEPVSTSKLLQAWALLRKIPFQSLFPAVTGAAIVVFFAVSGALAWLVVLLAFVFKLFAVVS